MKKLLIFVAFLIVIALISAGIGVILPKMSGTYKLGDSIMKIKIPYTYEKLDETTENTIINLYNTDTRIKISAVKVKKDFWSSSDSLSRVEEYIKVISAVNYDSNIKNVKIDTIARLDNKVSKVEVEVENPGGNYKTITIIPNEEVGNFVIEFMGNKEDVENNKTKIEEIISSIRIN